MNQWTPPSVTAQHAEERTLPVRLSPPRLKRCPTDTLAAFQWAAIFHKHNIRCIRGVDKIATYLTHARQDNKPGEHIIPAKISCGVCRSHIMDEGRKMCLLYPMQFRDVNEEKTEGVARLGPLWSPSKHICYGERMVCRRFNSKIDILIHCMAD